MRIALAPNAPRCTSCGLPSQRSQDWRQVYGHRCPHEEPCPAGGFGRECPACVVNDGRPVAAPAPAPPIDPARTLACVHCRGTFTQPRHKRALTCSIECFRAHRRVVIAQRAAHLRLVKS